MTSLPARLAGALGSGLLVVLAFPPLNWWPTAVLGAGLLALATRGTRLRVAALLGLLAGLAFFVPLLSWLRVIGVDAWLVLALIQSLFVAALGVGLALVARLPWWPLWVGAAWVAEEWARDRVPFGGFPWGRLAYTQADAPSLGLAALGGAPLVTFAVALAGGLLAAAVVALGREPAPAAGARRDTALAAAYGTLRQAPRGAAYGTPRQAPHVSAYGTPRAVRRAATYTVVAAAVLLVGLAVPRPAAGEGRGGPAAARVAVVQGNVPRLGLDAFSQARAVVENHAAATEQLADRVRAGSVPAPDVVVWPENSSDFDPYIDQTSRQLIDKAVKSVGVPVLVGAIVDDPAPHRVRNSAIVWDPVTGPGATYVKRHPVPFGEYVPLRSVLSPWIKRIQLIPRDFVAGREPGVLRLGSVRIADVICFEIAYDEVVRDAVNGGGRLIVVQTNNATYEQPGDDGRSGETAQQLEMSRLRAVEHGRAVLVSATSGVSAVIDPRGDVVQRSGVFTREVLSAEVPLRDTRTVASRVGAVPEWVLALAAVGAAGYAALRRRRAGE